MDNINILYIISCFGPGVGGHYYSLLITEGNAKQFAKTNIASIGTHPPDSLNGAKNCINLTTVMPSFAVVRALLTIIKDQKISVVHAFDAKAYFYAQMLSCLTKVPVVLTKCGGPNPRRYYPFAKDLILYSNEDLLYFKRENKYKEAKLHLLPHRTSKTPQDHYAINEIRQILKTQAPIILRISRLSFSHKSSLDASINLVNKLIKDGTKCQLVIIGAVRDSQVLRDIQEQANDSITLITENKYTTNAARLLDLGDIVIATGRGAMEAGVLGKVFLCPTSSSDIPLPARHDTIQSMLDCNFSARSRLVDCDTSELYQDIRRLILSKQHRAERSEFLQSFAQSNFDIASVTDEYANIYTNAKSASFLWVDCAINFMSLLLSHLRNLRRLVTKNIRATRV